ncbi:MAG: hypothetical protein ACI4XF_08245 [Oscillospiraceae bacterium]
MNVKSYKKFTKNIHGEKVYLLCTALVLISSAAAFIHPIWIFLAAEFMWVCDMIIISYYPLMPNDTEKQTRVLMVSSSRRNALAGLLPSARQLMMKAVFSERLALLVIYTLGCVGAAVRLMFFGVDFPVWGAVAAAFFGALQMAGISAFYAFDSPHLHSIGVITSGFSPEIILIPVIAGSLSETQTIHTSISGGLAVIGFTLIGLLLSAAAHKKGITDSENTAYNGDKITIS